MPAQAQFSFLNLEQSRIWTPAQGGSIAPNLPDSARIVYEPDGIRLYTVSSLPFAGWMARCSIQLPPLPPQFSVALSLDVECDDGVPVSMQAVEMDTMLAMSDGRVGNTSFEYNLHSGGRAQIVDKAYHWGDIGFNFGALPPKATFQFANSYDQAAGLSSVQHVSIAGQGFDVPVPMQGIPFQDLKWAPNKLIIQLQSNMVKEGGACSVKFSAINATVSYSL